MPATGGSPFKVNEFAAQQLCFLIFPSPIFLTIRIVFAALYDCFEIWSLQPMAMGVLMTWYAHTGREEDKRDWQGLANHLSAVAERAALMVKSFGLEGAAFIAGLFHDLGKYNPAFQLKLEGRELRVDHSTAGAQVLLGLVPPKDRLIAELIAYAILGHHAGLPDRTNETDACYNQRMERSVAIDGAWRDELQVDLSSLVP